MAAADLPAACCLLSVVERAAYGCCVVRVAAEACHQHHPCSLSPPLSPCSWTLHQSPQMLLVSCCSLLAPHHTPAPPVCPRLTPPLPQDLQEQRSGACWNPHPPPLLLAVGHLTPGAPARGHPTHHSWEVHVKRCPIPCHQRERACPLQPHQQRKGREGAGSCVWCRKGRWLWHQHCPSIQHQQVMLPPGATAGCTAVASLQLYYHLQWVAHLYMSSTWTAPNRRMSHTRTWPPSSPLTSSCSDLTLQATVQIGCLSGHTHAGIAGVAH
jgi:hypothetical protein